MPKKALSTLLQELHDEGCYVLLEVAVGTRHWWLEIAHNERSFYWAGYTRYLSRVREHCEQCLATVRMKKAKTLAKEEA